MLDAIRRHTLGDLLRRTAARAPAKPAAICGDVTGSCAELAAWLPTVRLWNFCGQTEIAPLATVLGPDDQLRKAGSAGKPVMNVETRGVDDDLRDVAVGEIGEIVHPSPQLLAGYFHDDERTAAAFTGGWFPSGDLATVDAEGCITVVDRKKDMIKTGGENVSRREVEEAVYSSPGCPRWR